MSDEFDAPALAGKKAAKDEGKISLSLADLKELLVQSQKDSAEVLARAILESRKPYKDPGQEENDRRMQEQDRENMQRIRASIEASRDSCRHHQGCNELSNRESEASSFALHQLDTGELIGICTNCQKIISSLNPEDAQFFRAKSGNAISRAGQRFFRDPIKAQEAGRMVDDRGQRIRGF